MTNEKLVFFQRTYTRETHTPKDRLHLQERMVNQKSIAEFLYHFNSGILFYFLPYAAFEYTLWLPALYLHEITGCMNVSVPEYICFLWFSFCIFFLFCYYVYLNCQGPKM